ncbi:Transcriptional regulator, AraC family [Labilithrix luteola]|uniref:Transcriptional regulator, AraC family n=1 Tax=Labilithrix luteola TaxID=1391654 RepID=A0A0K1Q4C7_9BACT|nr:AraC family transcriptional regulator [Labilithrix luteola]AKV00594.1 Transcriptional regulator, AraC family [Labilithrix luteola]
MTADVIPVASAVLHRLSALGLDLRRLERHPDVPHELFESTKARLTTKQFFALWRAVEEIAGEPGFALRVGSDSVPERWNIASAAALCAPSYGEAIRVLGRYKRLICPEDLALETKGSEASLVVDWLLADEPPPPFLIDGTFASTLALGRHGTGKRLVAKRLELTRPEPPPAVRALLQEHFGCLPQFGCTRNAMTFEASVLDESMLTENGDLFAVMLPGLEARLDEEPSGGTLASRVADVVGRNMRGRRPTLQVVARDLRMSARTLQRRLEESGTNFQEVLDHVRRATARRLLQTTELDAGEIAFLLGFEEVNSFSRAFHVWEKTTPIRYRANVRA